MLFGAWSRLTRAEPCAAPTRACLRVLAPPPEVHKEVHTAWTGVSSTCWVHGGCMGQFEFPCGLGHLHV